MNVQQILEQSTKWRLMFQVFVLQQFDPGMEYRPDWGFKHPQQIQHANNGANALGHHQAAAAASAAAGRILRGAKAQGGPPGGPGGLQQQQGPPRGPQGGAVVGAANPNAGPGPGGGAGQDDKS